MSEMPVTQNTTHLEEANSRKKFAILAIILAVIGAAVSIYSIKHHLDLRSQGQTDAFCNINQTFSCDDVARSEFAELWGVPLGVYGLGYFLALIVLMGIGLKGKKGADAHLQLYGAMVGVGVLVSVVLGGISVFKVGAACLTCMMIYGVTLVQAGVFFAFRKSMPKFEGFGAFANACLTAALTVGVTWVAYKNLISPSPKNPALEQAVKSSANPENLKYSSKTFPIPVSKSAYSGFGEDYRKGGDDAAVTLVEFADFQCPSCARFASILKQVHEEFGNRVLVVFKNFPLDQACNPSMNQQLHENACAMAVGARCAGQYGKFWEFHDLLFARQKEAKEPDIKTWLAGLGIGQAEVEACFTSPSKYEKIKDDISLGQSAEVDGTPTLYINGRKYLGEKDLESLQAEIGRLLSN